MFDFVISRNQKLKLTRRLFASGITSCIAHFMLLIILIEFPQLLRGGIDSNFFRTFLETPSDSGNEQGRIITEVINPKKMIMPSEAALKRLLAALSKNEGDVPPPIARPGDVTARLDRPPMPEIRDLFHNPDLFLPKNNLAPIIATSVSPGTENPASGAGTKSGSPGGSQTANVKPVGVSDESTPKKIPTSIPSPPEIINSPAGKVDMANQIRPTAAPEITIENDPTGFPMDEYTNYVEQRIKQKWKVPSWLNNSPGNIRVRFYINKKGQLLDAKVIASSGSNSLDITAILAINSSSPFQPLPNGFPEDQVGYRFVFHWYGSH
jgi:TonB family protein